MPKANQLSIVDEIVNLLRSGQKRDKILSIIGKKCQSSVRTIDRYIKEATRKLKEEQQQAEEIRVREMDTAITEAVKKGLLSDTELEVILCRIASGGFDVQEIVNGRPLLRGVSPGEMVQAVRTLFQKRGSNAPTKTALTDSKGEDKEFTVTLNLS